jgi:hypothetical protein
MPNNSVVVTKVLSTREVRKLDFAYQKPQENFHQYLQRQTLLKLVTVEHKDLVMIARKFEIPQTKCNQNID